MRFLCLLALFIALVAVVSSAGTKCGTNEEYRTCGNACEPTCQRKNTNLACTAQCVDGCFCKQGYLHNSKGVCVKEKDCS